MLLEPRELGVGVPHARQERGTGPRAQLVQQIVAPRIGVQLGHARIRIVERTERDRLRRAPLLARGLELAVPDQALLDARVDALALDALHAVRALFHDAAAAHGDVGVHAHPAGAAHVAVVLEEVETAHLVRAVVAAIPRADAAVIGHLVQSLVAVDGGVDRADVLARRGLAVHAAERLGDHLGIFDWPSEVAVDANPLHLATSDDLLLADDRDVVLGLAGDDARAATRALAQVDRHAPLVGFLAVVVGRVSGRRYSTPLFDLLVELRVLVEGVRQSGGHRGLRRLAAVGRHAPVVLGDAELVAAAGLHHRRAT